MRNKVTAPSLSDVHHDLLSALRAAPHEFESIPFPVKVLKLLLHDLHTGGDSAAITMRNGDIDSDDGVGISLLLLQNPHDLPLVDYQDSAWADEDGEEKLIQGMKEEEFAYLSEILGGKTGQFDEDEDGVDGGLDDEDLRQDPVSTMDMKVCRVSLRVLQLVDGARGTAGPLAVVPPGMCAAEHE